MCLVEGVKVQALFTQTAWASRKPMSIHFEPTSQDSHHVAISALPRYKECTSSGV